MSKTFREIHITGEGFRTLGIYRLFFKAALAEALKHRADYDEEVRRWYLDGEGAAPKWVTDVSCANCGTYFGEEGDLDQAALRFPCEDAEDGSHVMAFRRNNVGGQGHTFPRCIHGMSLWTDYDNICGGCEEGETAIEEAIVSGREAFLRFNQRWEWVASAPGDLAYDTRRELLDWATSLFPKADK